jgi:hypothetical protein
VLYSANGNSADEHWYNRGVIAYSFETEADRFVNPTLSVPAAAGATGVRASNRNGYVPLDGDGHQGQCLLRHSGVQDRHAVANRLV